MHSETFCLRNHPSRHRKERDDAALLTQEGNSPPFTVIIILCSEPIWDSSAWPAIGLICQVRYCPNSNPVGDSYQTIRELRCDDTQAPSLLPDFSFRNLLPSKKLDFRVPQSYDSPQKP
jgi:hypothetical protein